MNVDEKAHWNANYASKGTGEVSWFESSPRTSLSLIERADLDDAVAVIDVGGGASQLAHELVDRGYRDVTVADVSAAALQAARSEYGTAAERVQWIEADVRTHDFGRRFDLWHDRAVFHFMVDEPDRASYLATLRRSLNPGGHLVLATFGPEGPTSCSGLPVRRYGVEEMSEQLGEEFELLADEIRMHRTPGGNEQQFQYALFRRQA